MTDNDKAAKQKATDEWFETHKSTPGNYDDEAARMDMLLLLAFGDGYDTAEAQHAERVRGLVDALQNLLDAEWMVTADWTTSDERAKVFDQAEKDLAEHRTEDANA